MGLTIKTSVLICLLMWLLFIACHQKQQASIGYGKQIYTSQCLACHNYKNSVDDDKSTLLKMSEYDSTSLLRKLMKVERDAYHKEFLKDTKYSDFEAESILFFIKSFNSAVPNKPYNQ